MEKASGGQSFLASIQNLTYTNLGARGFSYAIFLASYHRAARKKTSGTQGIHTRNWSENWCSGFLKHALSVSEIHLAVARTLEIIGHVTNYLSLKT